MKYVNIHLLLITLITMLSFKLVVAQDTFSIVAVDTLTGEIGSAGASCVGPIGGVGAFILSDVIEGIGGIHTQASYNSVNQINARNRMLEGLSPQQIIDWLVLNDVQGNPTVRQYGIVDLTRNGESAAYTGVNCINYKNHVTGPGYAVQGNILLGQMIIDTMQNTFLNTPGPLIDRLIKTLEAAKIIGADTRCASRGTSSQSAFLKVVRIGDGNTPYAQLVVPDSPVNVDPIDLLKAKFLAWKDSLFTVVDPFLSLVLTDNDTLFADGISTAVITIMPKNNSDTLLAPGKRVNLFNTGQGSLSSVTDLGNGIYEATLTAPLQSGTDTISAKVISGTDTVSLSMKAVINYIMTTGTDDISSVKPDTYFLYPNYPQPFNPVTKIKFRIPETAHVKLTVSDVLGNEIVVLNNGLISAGTYEVIFDGSDFSSGTYFYTLRAENYSQTRKMTLIK